MHRQLGNGSLQCLQKVFTGNTGMIRIEVVPLHEAEDHLVEEGFIGVPKTTSGVRAARAAETHVCVCILLAMQRSSQRDQSPGVSLRIFLVARDFIEMVSDDFSDICGNLACVSAAVAEAVKPQVFLGLMERIRNRIDFQRSDGVLVFVHTLIRAGDSQGIGLRPSHGST